MRAHIVGETIVMGAAMLLCRVKRKHAHMQLQVQLRPTLAAAPISMQWHLRGTICGCINILSMH